jgi:hypothetical protein
MDTSNMGQLYTWQGLYSVAQMSMLLYLIVQFSKTLIDRYFPGFPTDFYSLTVAYFIIITVQAANGANMTDWKNWLLGFFNSFMIVAASGYMANKAQNPPTMKPRTKKKPKDDPSIVPDPYIIPNPNVATTEFVAGTDKASDTKASDTQT